MTASSIGIIGVGNPLRKDDGIGIVLLHHMKNAAKLLPDSLSFIDGGTGGIKLLYTFNKFDIVIVLDAVDFKGKPGESRFFLMDDIQSEKKVSSVSTHNEDLFQIIRIGWELDECPKKIYVFGVQPADVSFGEGLTDSLQNQISDIFTSMKQNILMVLKENSKNLD